MRYIVKGCRLVNVAACEYRHTNEYGQVSTTANLPTDAAVALAHACADGATVRPANRFVTTDEVDLDGWWGKMQVTRNIEAWRQGICHAPLR